MSITDRLHEAKQLDGIHETKQAPKHGPVRTIIEEALFRADVALVDPLWARLGDTIDALFDQQAKLISEAHSRITAGYNSLEARIEELGNLVGNLSSNHDRLWLKHSDRLDHLQGVISGVAEKVDSEKAQLEKSDREAHQRITYINADFTKRADEIDKRLSDLADRLSLVHVQAQGDAKIRAKVHLGAMDIGGSDNDPRPDHVKRWVTPEGGYTKEAQEMLRMEVRKTGWDSADDPTTPPDSAGQPETWSATHPNNIANAARGMLVARTRDDKAARLDELEKAHRWVVGPSNSDRPRNWFEYLDRRRSEIEKGAA